MTIRFEVARGQRDHLSWILALSESVDTMRTFNRELDPNNCSLGRWLNTVQIDNVELRSTLDRLHTYHNRVHEAGTRINQIIASTGPNRERLAQEVYEQEARPMVERVVGILAEADAIAEVSYNIMNRMKTQAIDVNYLSFERSEEILAELIQENASVVRQVQQAGNRNANQVRIMSLVNQ